MWVPSLLVTGAVLLPVAYLIVRALGADEGIWSLLIRARTLQVLLRTLTLAAAVTAGTIVLAVPLAWLIVRTDLPGARLWSALTALPLVVPSYVGGLVIATIFGPAGTLQHLLNALGGLWRVPEIYGFPGAWLTLVLFTYPYVLLSVRAGLRGLDPSLEESSHGLGQGAWTTFRRVTLPLLRPWIRAGALLVALYVLSDFGAVSMMQFESFTTAIYLQYQGSLNRSYAAVLSLVLVAVATIILLIEGRDGRLRYHRVGPGSGKPPRQVQLGAWTVPALISCGVITTLGVLLPVAVIGYWLVVGLRHGQPLILPVGPLVNSFYASALGAGATLLAALPIAILSARHGGAGANLTLRLIYAAYALPGLVIALALVFFTARYLPAFYQTVGLLVFAYAVHFLPQAVGPLRSALLQVSPAHEEAAQTLGRTPREVLWAVTLPLVRPGVIAATALVFLTCMKELPATLLLSPTGFETLATRVWSAATEGFFTRAAPPALLLLGLSSLSMWAILAQDERRSER
ncbi:MAG: ABC transporter permease [Armatimonadota bacterium]